MSPSDPVSPPAAERLPRERKFRQAAFVYLHVGLLYEFAAFALWRHGFTSHVPGSAWVWFAGGAAIVALVVWGLWSWQNPWLARVVWGIHALRLPALIDGAFLRAPGEGLVPPSFFLVALFVILLNLWMLARAGWDL